MQEAVLSPLATWQNFYVIIGSAAATLTGLMFVVMTLRVRGRRSSGALGAFATRAEPWSRRRAGRFFRYRLAHNGT